MKRFLEISGNGLQYLLVAVQSSEILQIAELIISILTTLFILFVNIWTWWKKAKADGKITKDELKEGIDIVTTGVEEIEEKIKK